MYEHCSFQEDAAITNCWLLVLMNQSLVLVRIEQYSLFNQEIKDIKYETFSEISIELKIINDLYFTVTVMLRKYMNWITIPLGKL